mmetsp:Transcript_105255/g.234977  ORF Transcript_105255/g.234977 Transcript_105255/m.234977 type:complete len:379 (+) Transcript_105255:104-1240(+)
MAHTGILYPSGEDANPLNRRLPAEVVTRRRREVKKVEVEKKTEPAEVAVDLKVAITLKPEARTKWLTKACKMAEEGRASTTELYNIISSRRFVAVSSKIGRKLRDIVYENVKLFSDKQQRFLRSEEWALNTNYGEKPGDGDEELRGGDADGDREAKAEEVPLPEKDEDVPARRTFSEKTPARSSGGGSKSEKSAAARAPPTDDNGSWIVAPVARGQDDRARREVVEAEERAKRKKREREDQDRWLQAEEKRAEKQREAKQRQLEDEVDSSMMLLESLGKPAPEPEPERRRDREGGRRHEKKGLSRSRSVSVAARSRSRGRKGRDKKSGKRGRRSSSGSPPANKQSFDDALKRRLAEREARDTTRIPVVDPGHAQRAWR